MKNKYLSKINYDYSTKVDDINDLDIYDLFETEDYILYVITYRNEEINIIKAKRFPLKNSSEEEDLVLDLSNNEDRDKIYFLFKEKNNKDKEIKTYFKISKYKEQNFDKSEVENYKINDILIDSTNKAWFVNSVDLEEEKIEVVKLPVILDQLAHTYLSIKKEIIQNSIKEIWR